DLNHIYITESTVHETDSLAEAFKFLDLDDDSGNLLAFLRRGNLPGEVKLFAFNFGASCQTKLFGVPEKGSWKVEINSSSTLYGGTLCEDQCATVVAGTDRPPYSIELDLPAFSAQILQYIR
ncbi:MAG: hypothetical protein HN996_00605, partial [Opitutae bacterium]|nr:hypothetical protein [Opitutae bacterium]